MHIRLTEDGQVGLLCTLTPHENKISSKDNGPSLNGDTPTEQRFRGTNSDTINISNEVVKKFSSHMGEPGNDARK